MSCFGMASGSSAGWPMSPSPSSRRRRGMSVKPWRLWWRRCAGVAAAIQSKIRRRAVRWPGGHGGGGRRRREAATASTREREGWCHHRSFAPVYVDELYSHPKTHHVAVHEAQAQAQQPNTTAAKTNAGAASGKARAVVAAAAANNNAVAATNASASFAAKNAAADAATNAAGARAGKGRAGGGKKAAAATNNGGAKAARGGVRSLLMSPLRGGGACGMGEVDVRAEVFIRKFREEMRLQNQKSAEEFQAMLARGL